MAEVFIGLPNCSDPIPVDPGEGLISPDLQGNPSVMHGMPCGDYLQIEEPVINEPTSSQIADVPTTTQG